MPRDLVAPVVAPSLESLLATPEPFRAWLKSLPLDLVLNAECYLEPSCPIQAWLLAEGKGELSVLGRSVWGNPEGLIQADWIGAFTDAADRVGDMTEWRTITASVALRLLDRP